MSDSRSERGIHDPSWIGYGPPEWDEPEDKPCPSCNGTGCDGGIPPTDGDDWVDPCDECNGTGIYRPEGDPREEWHHDDD